MTPLSQQLQSLLPGEKILADVSLAASTYFKIGGPADVLVELTGLKQIAKLVKFCQEQKIPLSILGGASNVVVTDKGIRGVVLKVINQGFEVLSPGLIRVGAGWRTSLLVRRSVDEGYTGLEKFLGVPGMIGGAIFNNAHYLTDLIGPHVARVQVVTQDGEVKWLSQAECEFAYDYSRFHHSGEVICMIEFSLQKGDKESSDKIIREATIYRAKTQPLGEPSSGCYFRNSPNTPELMTKFPQFATRKELPSGFLIEQAGLKGLSVGDVRVSEKHAAFIVNKGHGTSSQVRELAGQIQASVQQKFGVELKPEVLWLGEL